MNAVTRGVRNAFRNSLRTVSIVIILGLSVGLAMSMLVARSAVQEKITNVKASVGNTIAVSPAGARGFEGGGEPLTSEQMNTLAQTAHVTKVVSLLNERLTTDTTNLVSAIEPGTLGNRGAASSGIGFQQGPPPDAVRQISGTSSGTSQTQVTRTFTPPVTVTGVNDLSVASVYGGDSVKFTAGEAFDASKDTDVAAVGSALATKNNLSVGSTFTVHGTTVTVVGVYDAGNTFANAGIVMPLAAVQRLASLSGQVSSATVYVDSVDNLTAAVDSIKSTLGDTADVTSNQDSVTQIVAPLENVKSISMYSLVGALVAGAVIILLTMMMIVRERRREIGVMKAIGATNKKTVLQFMSEAVTLTVFGLMVGLVIGVFASNPITKVLVNNSSSSTTTLQTQQPPARGVRGLRGAATNISNVTGKVGADTILYGVAASLAIAIIGSAIPAYIISKIRPADVMRAE